MNNIRNIFFGLMIGVFVLSPVVSFAVVGDGVTGGAVVGSGTTAGGLPNPLGSSNGTIYEFIKTLLEIFVKIGLFFSVMAFVYSGFLFVKSADSDTERTKAKNAFFNTIIGTALLLGAWGLARIIELTIKGILTP